MKYNIKNLLIIYSYIHHECVESLQILIIQVIYTDNGKYENLN